jgi:hypothetical protein
MSGLEPEVLQRQLLLEQAITRRLDEVVQLATRATLTLQGNRDMQNSQLRNLLSVAVESQSIEVVVNYIRYQIARMAKAWGTGPQDFGHHVIADIYTDGPLERLAHQVLQDVTARAGTTPEVMALEHTARMRLVELYLGYLSRAFYFAEKTKDFDALKGVAGGRTP